MKNKPDVRRMTELALLMAIIIVMAYTRLGYLNTPWGLPISLIVIPVAVGGIVLGPKAGAFLGMVFGLTSFTKTFGDVGLGVMMMEASPVGYFVLCVAPRILVGWLPSLLYQWLRRYPKGRCVARAVCCFLTPVINTLLYMTTMWLLFGDVWVAAKGQQATGLNLLWIMLGGVAVNGVVEAAACLLVGTAVSEALLRTLHRADA